MYIYLDGKIWSYVSDAAKDLIKKMLSFDASSRPSAVTVLNHSWIVNGKTLPEENLAALIKMETKDVSKEKLYYLSYIIGKTCFFLENSC